MEHHPVFAEGDGSAVAIGCDVPDGEEWHDSAVRIMNDSYRFDICRCLLWVNLSTMQAGKSELSNQMKSNPEPSTQEVLAGLVERVTFHNAENGFCVLRAKARGHRDLVTVVGHAAIISAGEWITAPGEWINDRAHGQQFKARFLKTSAPSSIDGIEKYLGSGMIRGVGPGYELETIFRFVPLPRPQARSILDSLRANVCREWPLAIARHRPLPHSNSGNGNLRPETLDVTRRERSPERANPIAETGSPRIGYGNVELFLTLGNHVDLRGLPGGAKGIQTAMLLAMRS
jgi:hypothetical protein